MRRPSATEAGLSVAELAVDALGATGLRLFRPRKFASGPIVRQALLRIATTSLMTLTLPAGRVLRRHHDSIAPFARHLWTRAAQISAHRPEGICGVPSLPIA